MSQESRLFDNVDLLVALPDEPYAGSHLPADWQGLVPGDQGAIVEVYDTPLTYTVEFFRKGKTVAITDVIPAQVRTVWQHPANRAPEP